jgi:curved DNA-binding protein CbpA
LRSPGVLEPAAHSPAVPSSVVADAPELSEQVDLEMEHRRYILDAHARIEQITHYELLGVRPNADKREIKKAYYALAGVIHPDRYFGKNLGSYKPKMEVLYARITKAFELLSSKSERAQYDAELAAKAAAAPPPSAEQPPASTPLVRAPVDPRIQAKRQEAMDALKARFADAKTKAQDHVAAAKRAHAAGDFVAAEAAYRTALALSPSDEALRAAHAEVREKASASLLQGLIQQAALQERFGRWADAAASWRKILAERPSDQGVKDRLDHALAMAARDGGG